MSVEAARAEQSRVAAREAAAKTSVARMSVALAAFLIVLKTIAGWLTGSISVWASLLDSSMDVLASALNFLAVRAAARPPDEDHLYGHGKAESLAGLFQATVVTASGLFLIAEAVGRLFNPREITNEWVGVGTMLTAALLSALLVARLRRVARATDSPALKADALHYSSDVYTNSAALAAILLVRLTGWKVADPLISIALSAVIIRSAFGVGRDAVDVLMDRRLPAEIDEKVADVVGRFKAEGVLGLHDLRTRRSGALKFIDLHLEVERGRSLEDAHALTVKVIHAIESEIPRSRVHVHTDPAG